MFKKLLRNQNYKKQYTNLLVGKGSEAEVKSSWSAVCWATHVLQGRKQRVTIIYLGVNLEKSSRFGLSFEIQGHEIEIVSNRRLARCGE